MKKNRVLYTIITLCLLVLPSFAAKWVEFDTKSYIDVSSIRKIGSPFSPIPQRYSFWVKILNRGTEPEKKIKDLWYTLDRINIDCSEHELAVVSYALYDIHNRHIHSYDARNPQWSSIIPGTYGDFFYNYVCNGEYKNTSKPVNEVPQNNSLIKYSQQNPTNPQPSTSSQDNSYAGSIYEYLK